MLLLVLFATSDLHRSREADVRGDGTRRGGVYTATAAKLKKWTAHGNATPGRGAAAALPTDETDAGGCAVWRCTCLGYSNHFDAWPNHWGSAVTEPHRQWWLAQHCATTPNRAESLTERPNDAVIKSAVVAGGAPAAETQKPPSHPSPPPPHPSPPPPFPSPSSASTFEPSSPRAATQFVVNDRAGPACEAGGRPIASPLDCSSAVARIRGADNFGGKVGAATFGQKKTACFTSVLVPTCFCEPLCNCPRISQRFVWQCPPPGSTHTLIVPVPWATPRAPCAVPSAVPVRIGC